NLATLAATTLYRLPWLTPCCVQLAIVWARNNGDETCPPRPLLRRRSRSSSPRRLVPSLKPGPTITASILTASRTAWSGATPTLPGRTPRTPTAADERASAPRRTRSAARRRVRARRAVGRQQQGTIRPEL